MADIYSLFDGLTPQQATAVGDQFEPILVQPGDTVVEEGEINDAMLLIESGEVAVIAGGFEVTRMGPGAMIGEIGLFAHAVRTATVRATAPTMLHRLTREALLALRRAHHPVAFRIERRAVQQLVGRVRALVNDVSRLPSPVLETITEDPGEALTQRNLDVLEALSIAPCFAGADPQGMRELAAEVQIVVCGAGEALGAAGGVGPALFVVRGAVDVLLQHPGGWVRLGSIEQECMGDLIHQVDKQPRPWQLVAAEPLELLLIPQHVVTRMLYANDAASSALRVAMIRSLADRVNQVNGVISLAKLMNPSDEDEEPGAPASRQLYYEHQWAEPAPLGGSEGD